MKWIRLANGNGNSMNVKRFSARTRSNMKCVCVGLFERTRISEWARERGNKQKHFIIEISIV